MSCQQCSGGAHDFQKPVRTQNLESPRSKITEIFLSYFHLSKSAHSLNQSRKLAGLLTSGLHFIHNQLTSIIVLVYFFYMMWHMINWTQLAVVYLCLQRAVGGPWAFSLAYLLKKVLFGIRVYTHSITFKNILSTCASNGSSVEW